MANVKNIDQVIMIGRDDEGNEVLFNFKGVDNCALVTQSFSTVGGTDSSTILNVPADAVRAAVENSNEGRSFSGGIIND